MTECTTCDEMFASMREINEREHAKMMAKSGRPRKQADGSVMFPPKGKEPPADLDGYQRDPKNAWKFLPIWPNCQNRVLNLKQKKCGQYRSQAICIHPEGEYKGIEVSALVCQACILK